MNYTASVRAWEEQVTIPTYPALPPDRNPMFLEKRVYQGSSGKVYPNPFTDRVSNEKIEKSYQAVMLENEYLRLMILPEIGGRIHVGLDKTNGYDFFYRQHVIKPALVGLLGPWLSGGVEFNWPQHHRPSTFMPVDWSIEEGADGSRTVWLSEHEPMQRMKGMVGIRLHPGKSFIEANVRLYNRTPLPRTFLWWANVGIRVHDQYQAFFPPDVTFVADHAKRAISQFPVARNLYYGVDYTQGVDITWYKNIPVPTSYMVTESKYDFFGGYDHSKKAGVVHYADHHIAPGKKLWTWGNAEFGYAWDRNLTDDDDPYIELMAGVYTDNQPDFSWLAPFETKCFRQYWYPIQQIGPAKNANLEAAVNLECGAGTLRAGVCVTRSHAALRVLVTEGQRVLLDHTGAAAPGYPMVFEQHISDNPAPENVVIRVLDDGGRELIRWQPEPRVERGIAKPADEPPAPAEIASADELYVTGLHLEQYRHATRSPELYWEEALRRDPLDSRANNALGLRRLRRGEFEAAEQHFRAAIERLTRRNPNPYDGESHYNLGLALRYQDLPDEAAAVFHKSAWNYAWKGPAGYALAELACQRDEFQKALSHLDEALAANPQNLKARDLKAGALRRLDRNADAARLARETLAVDPLDWWARQELALATGGNAAIVRDVQTALDIAFDCAAAGLIDEAREVLLPFSAGDDAYPMVFYTLAWFGGPDSSAWYKRARRARPDYCFPARIEEMLVLEAALRADASDGRAHYYLGNLLYDKKRYREAIGHWEAVCACEPEFSIPWRNLGIASFNVLHKPADALECYRRAFAANPNDARLLYEMDQLRKRLGTAPEARLAQLRQFPHLVEQRDDLSLELVTLNNRTGLPESALEILGLRRFNPWEGGEGLVSGQYVASHVILGRAALDAGHPEEALEHFEAARYYPDNLGEGKHQLTLETHLDYFSGLSHEAAGRIESARRYWRTAADAATGWTYMKYYRALALAKLGETAECKELLDGLLAYARRQRDAEIAIDYFATSLPNFLLFEDDFPRRKHIECAFLEGLAHAGLGDTAAAIAALEEVMELDVNHLSAAEELKRLMQEATEAPVQ
jgi:tetratricopeptide (TPR) repeat protein